MSIEAVAWALNTADVQDATEVLVLIGIANHAAKDGTGSRAGQATLAHYARCSDRTVRRKLAALEDRGLIRRGDQRAAEHIPRNVRPVVWDLVLPGQNDRAGHSVRSDSDPRPDTGGSEAGHSSVLNGRTRMSVEPLEEPSDEPSDLKDSAGPDFFAEFWAVYPRHEKRAEAVKAWPKAVKAADPAAIIAGASRYAADPNREPKFTAHASSWLNGCRWDDDPLPASGGRDRQGDILAAELSAARANDERRAAVAGALDAFPAPAQVTAGGGPFA
jgi:hypothetical protein